MRPLPRALALAAAAPLGLVGMLVLDGVGDRAMLAITLAPMAIAVISYARARHVDGVSDHFGSPDPRDHAIAPEVAKWNVRCRGGPGRALKQAEVLKE